MFTSGRIQKSWQFAVVGLFSKAFFTFDGNDNPNNRLSAASICKKNKTIKEKLDMK